MNYKYLFNKIGLLLLICLSVISCSSGNKPKVGFLIPNTTSARYAKERDYFAHRLTELGGEMLSASAENDDKVQMNQAEKFISEGVKVLVVNAVNLATAAAIVREAHQKGVEVIAYDRLILNSDLDYYLSFDNKEVGKLMANYVVKMKPEGKYILICGDRSDMNASLVREGQMEVIGPLVKSGKISIELDESIEDWSALNASHEIKHYMDLTGKIPDVILSSNDGMATGIIELLKEKQLTGSILITGQDAELDACRNIAQGYQTMTVYKSIKKLANEAAELAIHIIHHERVSHITGQIDNGMKAVPSILLQPEAVDKDNLRSSVIADGFYKESDIY